jgi:hypothetical protein
VVAGVDESIAGQRSSRRRRTTSREWAYHSPASTRHRNCSHYGIMEEPLNRERSSSGGLSAIQVHQPLGRPTDVKRSWLQAFRISTASSVRSSVGCPNGWHRLWRQGCSGNWAYGNDPPCSLWDWPNRRGLGLRRIYFRPSDRLYRRDSFDLPYRESYATPIKASKGRQILAR